MKASGATAMVATHGRGPRVAKAKLLLLRKVLQDVGVGPATDGRVPIEALADMIAACAMHPADDVRTLAVNLAKQVNEKAPGQLEPLLESSKAVDDRRKSVCLMAAIQLSVLASFLTLCAFADYCQGSRGQR